jgi:hypothetical protein
MAHRRADAYRAVDTSSGEKERRRVDDTLLTRRAWMARVTTATIGGAALALLRPATGEASAAPTPITVYKDPSCDCCTKWVAHLRGNGFAPQTHDRSDMDALKDSLGVPPALRSCHTAMVGTYVIEGHVPAADVARLVSTKPAKTLGLAVPGMPAGSPGMEMGNRADRFDVVAFDARGATRVFGRH